MKTGEFDLIDKIRRFAGTAEELQLGIGDDCSVISIPVNQELLTSTDLLLEGIHFRLDWTDAYRLGRKAVSVNLSDIAAMGGQPLCLYLGLGIPAGFNESSLNEFLAGFHAAMSDYGVCLAGGDTCGSEGSFTISVSVQGFCMAGQAVRRAGAAVGDDLWVSGTLGDSALALRQLQAGEVPADFLAERHFNPTARVRLGVELGQRKLATAMLDLSDGLLGDLGHILRASGCGARIEQQRLPLSREFQSALRADAKLMELAMNGGEDYELLFSAASDKKDEIEALSRELDLSLQRVGCMTDGGKLECIALDGEIFSPRATGFDHLLTRTGRTDD